MLQFGTTFPEARCHSCRRDLRRRVRSAASCSGGGDLAPCGSAPSPLLCSRSQRRPRSQLRAPEAARRRATPTPRCNNSARGHIRRCSASTRSTLSCRHGTRGSGRSQTEEADLRARQASLEAELDRGRGLLQDEPAQPGPRAARPLRAGRRRSGRRRARSEVAQHGPQPARRPVARRGPEPADRGRDGRGSSPPTPVATPARGGEAAARPLAGRRPAGRAEARSGGRVPGRVRLLPAGAGASTCGTGPQRRVAGTGRSAEVADSAAARRLRRRRASGNSP